MMEIEEGTEGPHKALTTEVTLDLILSFLDAESQLAARQVCKKWNDRVLAKFDNKLTLRFDSCDGVTEIRPKLKKLDPRFLSSMKFQKMPQKKLRRVLVFVIGFLRSGGNIGRLRCLRLQSIDTTTLDYLIELANEGVFKNLKELAVILTWSNADKSYRCVNLVDETAFPKLKNLELTVEDLDDELMVKIRAANLPVAIQSFVSAAPNLVSLSTMTCNFSGLQQQQLKQLKIHEPEDHDEVNGRDAAISMISSVKNSLTSLSLNIQTQSRLHAIPELPKLSTLKICDTVSSDFDEKFRWPVWGFLPNLSAFVIEVSCRYLAYEDPGSFRALLPLPENVTELHLKDIPGEAELEDNHKVDQLFNVFLNIGVPRLVVEFEHSMKMSSLLYILMRPEIQIQVNEELYAGKRPRVLEFLDGEEEVDVVFQTKPVRQQHFSSVVEKLKKNWDVVRFKNFKFQVECIEAQGASTTSLFS